MIPSHPEPLATGDLVAFRPCGCLGFAAARAYMDANDALELARCVLAGWTPGSLTTAEVRAARWSCPACERLGQDDRPLPELAEHDQADRSSPRWRATGTMTFTVTIPIDGVVVAPDRDAAESALAERFSALYLRAEDEEIQVAWDSDQLITAPVPPGAAPSQGGPPLPEGVAQRRFL